MVQLSPSHITSPTASAIAHDLTSFAEEYAFIPLFILVLFFVSVWVWLLVDYLRPRSNTLSTVAQSIDLEVGQIPAVVVVRSSTCTEVCEPTIPVKAVLKDMDSEVHVQSSVHITQLAITACSDDTDAPGLSAAHNVPKVARKYRASPLSGCVRPRSAHADQGCAYGDPSNHGAPSRASTRAIRDPTTPPLRCTSTKSLEIAGKSRICQSRETPSDSGSTPVANTLYAGQLSSGLHNTSVPSVNVNESVSMSNNRISIFIKAMTESDVRTLYSIPGMAHMARSVQHALDVDATKKSAVDMLAPAILAERNPSPGTVWIAEHNRRIQKSAQEELDRIYHEEERRLREAFLARFGLESFSQFDRDVHVSGPEDSDADSASVYSTDSVNDSVAVLYHMRAPPMNDELSKGNS